MENVSKNLKAASRLPRPGALSRISGRMQSSAGILTDGELVANIRQGDSAAETALYEKYSSRVLFLALSELRSKPDAEDVRSETFLRVLLAVRQNQLRSPESLGSFIVGIALNVIREHLRQNPKMGTINEQHLDLASGKSIEATFLDSESMAAIEDVVRLLKPRERAFLRMHFYDELPKSEIARLLGVKEERLRLIKSRALRRFREVYKKITNR